MKRWLLIDLKEVEAVGVAAAAVLGRLQAAEGRVRHAEILEAVFPVDEARGDRRAQRARVVVALARLVGAETAVEVVIALAADQPVVAVVALDAVVAGL